MRQETYDSILTGDKFVLRVCYFGTHKGEFMGVPATGRKVVMPGIGIFRVENGKAVENWAMYDIFSVYQQVTAPAK
jgi:predicted ester cyclase